MGAIFTNIAEIFANSGWAQIFFAEGGWKYAVMIGVACVLLYLAIVHQFEPLLLLPIGFGMLMTNLPLDGIFHMDTKEPFAFDWDWLAPSGLSTRDFIAPASFEFPDGRTFRIGEKFCSASFLQITAADLSDRALEAFLAVDSSLIVSMHIRAIDQTEAVKMVKRKITELDRTKIEEQKRAVRSGYDMDILPSDLTTLDAGAKDMLKSLQNHNERMLMLTFILVNAADTKRKLKADVQQCRSIAQTMNCSLVTLDFQQERAMQAALPLGVNPIRIERGLTTSALGIFIPFTTQELFQKSEGALYYGVNSLSHNMILVDRKLLSNPNGLILGTPGSGKSFAAKREMVNVFLVTDDDIIICDPEAEYAPLVRRLHGQIIRISPVGSDYINPLDINMNYADEEDPVTLKSDFVLSMCELIVGGKEGLQPIEKTVIDRCVRSVYQAYFADPKPETMPILEDLYVELKIQPEPEAQRIATALEIYVHGSLNLFNHRTNVNLKNRLVCYDIKGLGKAKYILKQGGTLGDLNQWGFSMAFPATFITLIVLMWPGFKNALPLTASGIVSAVCSFWLASHWCVLLGTLTGLVLAAFLPLHSENQAG